MKRRGRFVLWCAAVCMVLAACRNPVGSPSYGKVTIAIGGSGRAAAAPQDIHTVDIEVTADDMDDIRKTLTAPDLSATLRVPAGSDRSFSVLAKNSDGTVLYKGRAAADVRGGETIDLQIAMVSVRSVSYNANGGTGTVPETIYLDPGETVQVASGSGVSRSGYAFSGWNTEAAGGGTTYAPGATFAMPDANVVLYAQWQLVAYTISYVLNGGTSHSNPATYTVESAAIALTPAVWGANIFLGWYADAALTVPLSSIPAGSTGNLTLYAKWDVPSFNVTFEKNAAPATGSMGVQSIPNGATVPLAANAYVRPGYAFEGWGIAAGGPVVYTDGASYTMGASDVTLFAQWTAIDYTVTYDAQGGSATVPPSAVVTFDSNYATPPGTSRPGYTFGGWFTLPNGMGSPVTGGTPMTTAANHSIYAYWTANNYQVTFDKNAAMATGSMVAQNILFDASATLFSNSFIYPGYTFAGWGTSPGGPVVYANGSTFTMTTTGATLYAQWTIASYTVYYMANGAPFGTAPANQVANYGATVTVRSNTGGLVGDLIIPNAYGIRQRFTGWNTDPGGAGTTYLEADPLTLGAADVTLYAQFTTGSTTVGKIGPARGLVFYDKGSVSNGWQFLEAAPTDILSSAWSDQSAALLGTTSTAIGTGAHNTLKIISQPGHTLSAAKLSDDHSLVFNSITYDDWFLPSHLEATTMHAALFDDFPVGGYWSSSESSATAAYCPSKDNASHNTLKSYGYWVRPVRAFSVPAPVYVILYLANGADGGTVPTDDTRYAAAAGITLAANTGGLAKSGFVLSSWNTAADGSGTNYPLGGSTTMPAGNLVLYARWTP